MNRKGDWVGLKEIAARYGVSPHTVYKWCQNGFIPFGRAGRTLVFNTAETDAWARQRGSEGLPRLPVDTEKRVRERQAQDIATRLLQEV